MINKPARLEIFSRVREFIAINSLKTSRRHARYPLKKISSLAGSGFSRGFTLIETLVGIAVFVLIATASYQAYVSLFTLINLNQYKIVALNLANEQFEIIRNLSYSDVGIAGGIPNGKIQGVQTLLRSGVTFTVNTTIRNIDLPFDGTIGGSPNDLSPADNKFVELEIECGGCKNFTPIYLTTTIAPKNLETASTNGALFIKVFDANGVAVAGADVHVVNAQITPNIVIDDVTDNNGLLQIVDAPPGFQAYQITVTKNGYSTDRTYTPGVNGNTNPTLPDATVVIQQVTQVSLSIDRTSVVSFKSKTASCVVVPNIDFTLKGSKQIGVGIPKFSENIVTNGSGNYTDSTREWDTYTAVVTDGSYDVIGINPLNPIGINPNSTQNVDLIVATKNAKSLLVTVKDSATQLPVTDAVVHVTNSGSFDETQTTDRGFVNETDWSGGAGIDYTADDGNVDVTTTAGEIKLKNAFGAYNSAGVLESKTIDTGSATNFHNLVWSPTDQSPLAGVDSVRFQIATNASSTDTTWTYLGPDGTAGTYYTTSNSSISSTHNGKQYLRYKLYLATTNNTVTPNISDVAFTMTTSCTPPGQVIFTGLSADTYNISVSKTGFTTTVVDSVVSSSWKEQEIILSP